MGTPIQRNDPQREVSNENEDGLEHYRIISDPSWQVQGNYKGIWHTVYYCCDQKGAERCKETCENHRNEWLKLTPEERMKAILR